MSQPPNYQVKKITVVAKGADVLVREYVQIGRAHV